MKLLKEICIYSWLVGSHEGENIELANLIYALNEIWLIQNQLIENANSRTRTQHTPSSVCVWLSLDQSFQVETCMAHIGIALHKNPTTSLCVDLDWMLIKRVC